MERHILTVDVEDNFTYDELIDKRDWYKFESQVVDNTAKIISLLNRYNATATFFVVGHVAERHPEIVNMIIKSGHELASHSYYHKPLRCLELKEIEDDIRRSSEILLKLSGKRIIGYRGMGYSIPQDENSFYQLLKKYGYLYDSSKKYSNTFHTVEKKSIYHIYPSTLTIFRKKIVFSGGTYMRILPLSLIEKGFSLYRQIRQPVMIYIHPWEFNKQQPKRNVPFIQKVLQSPITFTTEKKLTYLLQKYRFVSIKEFLGVS